MPKKIVNAFVSNKIYLANVRKDGTMSDSGREEITDDVIISMFQHMKSMSERNDKTKYSIEGVGSIEFFPEEKTH